MGARWLGLALFLATGVVPLHQARAQSEGDRSAARDLGQEGLAAYQRGDYAEALDHFQRAHAIVKLTTTGLWTARCLVKVGRVVEASERYLEVTRMALPDDARTQHVQAKDDAARERAELLPRIPKLTLSLRGPADAEVFVDGVKVPPAMLGVPRPTDPGTHLLEARHGTERAVERIALREGEKRLVALKLTRAKPTIQPQPPRRAAAAAPERRDDGTNVQTVLGWTAIGVGGAGLVVAAVTGGLAVAKRDELDGTCGPERLCGPDLHDDVDTYQALRIASAVGLYAGAAIAATGVILLLTAPGDEGAAATIAPNGVALTGWF